MPRELEGERDSLLSPFTRGLGGGSLPWGSAHTFLHRRRHRSPWLIVPNHDAIRVLPAEPDPGSLLVTRQNSKGTYLTFETRERSGTAFALVQEGSS